MTLKKLALSILILIAVLTAVVQLAAYLRQSKVEASHPPTGQFVSVDGAQVHVDIQGPSDGRAVVLVHGASGSTRDLTFSLAPELAGKGYRVYTIDRPGMGYSDDIDASFTRAFSTKGASPIQQGQFLKKALDQLGVVDPILVGHSFGGSVVLGWALAHPDYASALVLLAAPSNPWPGELDPLYKLNGSTLGGGLAVPVLSAFAPQSVIDSTIEAIFRPDPAPDGYGDYIGARMTTRIGTMRSNARQVLSLRPYIVEMTPRYGTITQPVEILHGLADTIVPFTVHSEKLINQLPNAELTTIDGAGHMPQHTHMDQVIAVIDRAAARSAR
ncbi:alpha/beta fold hydrolase [Algirhabdus cladophorae]|uniref:alpha/beta fold hydrolase n=1 Tax=Algirhabdus cladophorae TaxID=3377108 RepID=UPI003B846646